MPMDWMYEQMYEFGLMIYDFFKVQPNFKADFIAQGTLYTDISESGQGYNIKARKAQIKLHHNVDLNFSIEESIIECIQQI